MSPRKDSLFSFSFISCNGHLLLKCVIFSITVYFFVLIVSLSFSLQEDTSLFENIFVFPQFLKVNPMEVGFASDICFSWCVTNLSSHHSSDKKHTNIRMGSSMNNAWLQ